jgi:N-acetylneuraminic acid mutarotase
MHGVCVGNTLYVWGGFSYSEPYTYTDGFRLSRQDGRWSWHVLPPLPSPTSWGGTCAIGSKIYVLGGSDYDAQRFYTLADRNGANPRLGARLIVFDADSPEAGWAGRTPCPGTPRCLTAAAVVKGMIYFIGGVAVADSGRYCNVVDNWRYDPASDAWERLPDMPISGSGASSNQIVLAGRYILLPCGYQYDTIMKVDGTIAPKYGEPSTVARTWENHPRFQDTHYFNHFYVYDTRSNSFGTATPLPFDDVATITVVIDDTAYMFPGETAGFVWNGEYYGHHPEFVLKGTIKELNWR